MVNPVLACFCSLVFIGCVVFAQNTHTPGTSLYDEHEDLYSLVSGPWDHTATQSGRWSDASTWGSDGVPLAGGDVHIPADIDVTYDGTSVGAIHTIFVEGVLRWPVDESTSLEVDTLINGVPGLVEIGTEEDPVEQGVVHDILFPAGAIDVSWDVALLSRGFISHGSVSIHGAFKTPHLKVAVDPMQGDTSLTLAETPVNWEVGDQVVLAGTIYDGYKWNQTCGCTDLFPPEDEVLTISSVSGTQVTFTPALVHNHSSPAERGDLKTSVGLLTRSVRFRSDPSTPVPERGHVMMMHSRTADVRFAQFDYLGRTDKSIPARSVQRTSPITSTSNVKGRYSFHFHRNGIPHQSEQREPSVSIGNSASHSAGWCFVHHDSHAFFDSNVAYDCFGAGFSAETGNEVGAWTRNLAIFSTGIQWGDPKNAVDLDEFDTGNSGDCFWFQSRMVRSAENVAASCNNAYSYFHRGASNTDDGASQLTYDSRAWQLPDALGLRTTVNPDDAPIRQFTNNEAFASRTGLHVVKANPHQGHDVHSHLKNHTAWNVMQCASITYTAHYIVEDFDCVGRPEGYFTGPQHGIGIENNAGDIVLIRPMFAGFDEGIRINPPDEGFYYRNYVIVNPGYRDTPVELDGFDSTYDTLLTSFEIEPRLEVTHGYSPLVYVEGGNPSTMPWIRRVIINGTKTDSLSTLEIPPVGDTGPDNYNAGFNEVIQRLETAGYFTDSEGGRWFALPDFYTDRGTGEVHMLGHWVQIDDNVNLGSPHFSYANATDAGMISFPDAPPTVEDEDVEIEGCEWGLCEMHRIDLLRLAQDPDGDTLSVAAILQPDRGEVFDNGDGTVEYRPDPGYVGIQTFDFWVTDGHANYVKGRITVGVDEEVDRSGSPRLLHGALHRMLW